jgi:hypothetical protein
LESLDFHEAVLEHSRLCGVNSLGAHASAGGGQVQVWNNNLFEFSKIPGLPDSRNPS